MNYDQLLQQYSKAETLIKIAAQLEGDRRPRLRLKGLVGSQVALAMLSVYRAAQRPMLIIADDKEEAAYLQNDLMALMK